MKYDWLIAELTHELEDAESARRLLDKVAAGQDVDQDAIAVLDALLYWRKDYDNWPLRNVFPVEATPLPWADMFYELGIYGQHQSGGINKQAREYQHRSQAQLASLRQKLRVIKTEADQEKFVEKLRQSEYK